MRWILTMMTMMTMLACGGAEPETLATTQQEAVTACNSSERARCVGECRQEGHERGVCWLDGNVLDCECFSIGRPGGGAGGPGQADGVCCQAEPFWAGFTCIPGSCAYPPY